MPKTGLSSRVEEVVGEGDWVLFPGTPKAKVEDVLAGVPNEKLEEEPNEKELPLVEGGVAEGVEPKGSDFVEGVEPNVVEVVEPNEVVFVEDAEPNGSDFVEGFESNVVEVVEPNGEDFVEDVELKRLDFESNDGKLVEVLEPNEVVFVEDEAPKALEVPEEKNEEEVSKLVGAEVLGVPNVDVETAGDVFASELPGSPNENEKALEEDPDVLPVAKGAPPAGVEETA